MFYNQGFSKEYKWQHPFLSYDIIKKAAPTIQYLRYNTIIVKNSPVTDDAGIKICINKSVINMF